MRINKTFWLWGLFPPENNNFLNQIKAKVKSKLISPDFETHITLAGPYFKIDDLFLKKLSTLGQNTSPIILDAKGYDFKQEFFKSFFVLVENTKCLQDLRGKIYELNEFELNINYSPHISLTYGEHETNLKKQLISILPQFNKQIKISQIALARVDVNINSWKIIKRFDLVGK